MSQLAYRILTAAVLAPLVIWWILYIPSPLFDWMLGAIGITALFELVYMLGLPLRLWFALSAAAGVVLILANEHAALAVLLLGLLWTALLMAAVKRSGPEHSLTGLAHKLALAYWPASWLLLFVWTLSLVHRLPYGNMFMLGAFIGVWVSDIAAYFAGRSLGKHKLCPPISPGKTVEGSLAGLLLGVPAAAAVWIGLAHVGIGTAMLLGLVLVITGMLGDLAESTVKRVTGVKDSGHLLPGHGGLLDRIDALVPAVSVTGLLWIGL